MDQSALFDGGLDDGAKGAGAAPPPRIGPKRLRHAVRNQVELQECSLDELLPEEHEARIVWACVGRLDLSELHQRIQAVERGPGQAPADPRILLALWLYATLRGVGSARELNRLCQHHAVYRWICGGVSMNYHTLSDFRTQHVELLDRLLTESVASLMAEGLVTLDRKLPSKPRDGTQPNRRKIAFDSQPLGGQWSDRVGDWCIFRREDAFCGQAPGRKHGSFPLERSHASYPIPFSGCLEELA